MYSTALSLCLLVFFSSTWFCLLLDPSIQCFLVTAFFSTVVSVGYFLLFLVSVEILTSVIHFPPDLSEHLSDHYLNSLLWKSLPSVSLRSFFGSFMFFCWETHSSISSFSSTLWIDFCKGAKTPTSPLLTEWSFVGDRPYCSARPALLGVSQTFVIVSITFSVLSWGCSKNCKCPKRKDFSQPQDAVSMETRPSSSSFWSI